ncbi:MAG: energy-coupling factor transporter transmembrane component T family protein [Eubacteriales bacterium]
MEGIVIGQYVPGNTFLHRLDPRTKLIISAALLWLIFLLESPVEYVGFGLLVIFLYILSGVTGRLLRVLRPAMYLLLFTLGLNMIFTPGHVLLNLGLVVATREGLIQGLTVGFRLVYLISLSSLVTLTTSPVRMTDGLETLMGPLKKARLPVSELAMMMNVALRFIPAFWEEMDKIRKAQVSRGADFDSWHPSRRIKYMTALLVPLLISAFRKAEELSVAMEARGYAVGMKRTSLHRLQLNLRDYMAILIVLMLTTAFVFNKYFV